MATRKKSPAVRTYECFQFRQRQSPAPTLVFMCAPVSQVLEWASVEELGPDTAGHQRAKREAKVEAIDKFFRADSRNIIPTPIIVAFAEGKAVFEPHGKKGSGVTFGTLKVDQEKTSAAVVDGQHRLYGTEQFDKRALVPLVGLLDADKVEKAFQFLIVNNKATKVPTTHAKSLLAKMVATDLVSRLKGANVALDVEGVKDVDIVNTDPDSPFFQSIDWSTTPAASRMIQATAIEQSLDYIAGLGVAALEDRDVRRAVFLTAWKTIKTRWDKYWHPSTTLTGKVGIICLTRFVFDLIVAWADNEDLKIDVTDLDEVAKQTEKVIGLMNPAFWRADWAQNAQGGFDTNQGRERVYQALKQLYRNGKDQNPWYADIDIIDGASVGTPSDPIAAKPRRATRRRR